MRFKLNHLNMCVKGETLELIKTFHLAKQLTDALKAFANAYSKLDFAISEIYKNLNMMLSFRNSNNFSF